MAFTSGFSTLLTRRKVWQIAEAASTASLRLLLPLLPHLLLRLLSNPSASDWLIA